MQNSEENNQKENKTPSKMARLAWPKAKYGVIIAILIIIGVGFLIYGSELFVSSAINFANKFNISESVIGLSLVAFGTSLPELVVGIMSAIKRKVDFALGNILGSNIYNVLGVLGISSFFGNFGFVSDNFFSFKVGPRFDIGLRIILLEYRFELYRKFYLKVYYFFYKSRDRYYHNLHRVLRLF